MSKPKSGFQESMEDAGRPFGTKPGRSSGPYYVTLILFLAWLGVLLYIAATQVGLKQ